MNPSALYPARAIAARRISDASPLLAYSPLLYYRASDNVTATGTDVTAWGNQGSISSANASTASAPVYPQLNASDSAYNNQATIQFAGTSWLTTGTLSGIPANDLVYWVVGSQSGAYTLSTFLNLTGSVAGIAMEQLRVYNTGNARHFSVSTGINSGTYTAGLPRAIAAYGPTSANAMTLYVNNALAGSATQAMSNGAGTVVVTLGALTASGSSPLGGKIAEVGVFNIASFGTTERSAAQSYAATRYGI